MSDKKQVRKQFRRDVMHRDGYRCRCCGAIGKDRNEEPGDDETRYHWTRWHWTIKDDSILVELDAHHITDRSQILNGGYVKENGITVCPDCHVKAERFHSTAEKEWEPGFHPNDLYAIIDSTYEMALRASTKLSSSED